MPFAPLRKLWFLAFIPAGLWAETPVEAKPSAEQPVGAEMESIKPRATEQSSSTEATGVAGYFLSRMASSESLATGVHELTGREQANLENLIAFEVHSAQAGGVTGFARTFSERRTEAELEATGIHRLSDDQRHRLDEHIAGFIAEQPVAFVYRGERMGGGSRVSRPTEGDFRGKGPLLNVNGSVTLEVGSSSAGTYYGGSVTTVISDPQGRFQAAISYGRVKGDTSYYYYDPRYRRGPYRPE